MVVDPRTALLATFIAVTIWFVIVWWRRERLPEPGRQRNPGPIDYVIGFGTNFFDTLGVGSFAPTTAIYKMLRRMPDEMIPGTLNVGHAVPTLVQALIFVAVVEADPLTLVSMAGASAVGAWIGAQLFARAPRQLIRITMGIALLVACGMFAASNIGLMPSGGTATGLTGVRLAIGIGINFVLGALMMTGVGLYGPCLITVSLLGMNPVVAFPIMMSSSATLMPIGGYAFLRRRRYALAPAIGLAVGGVPAVLIAAFVVHSMPLAWLRWLVVCAALVAAVQMLHAAFRDSSARRDPADDRLSPRTLTRMGD